MIVKKIKSGKLKPPNVVEHGKKVQMQLLAGVSGAFRPGILTCLFGVSGDDPSYSVLFSRHTGVMTDPHHQASSSNWLKSLRNLVNILVLPSNWRRTHP